MIKLSRGFKIIVRNPLVSVRHTTMLSISYSKRSGIVCGHLIRYAWQERYTIYKAAWEVFRAKSPLRYLVRSLFRTRDWFCFTWNWTVVLNWIISFWKVVARKIHPQSSDFEHGNSRNKMQYYENWSLFFANFLNRKSGKNVTVRPVKVLKG